MSTYPRPVALPSRNEHVHPRAELYRTEKTSGDFSFLVWVLFAMLLGACLAHVTGEMKGIGIIEPVVAEDTSALTAG